MLTEVTTDRALRGFLLAHESLPSAPVRATAAMAIALIRRSFAAAGAVQAGIALSPVGSTAQREQAERLSRFAPCDAVAAQSAAVALHGAGTAASVAIVGAAAHPLAAAAAVRTHDDIVPVAATPRSPQAPIQAELVSLVARGDAAAPPSLARELSAAADALAAAATVRTHDDIVQVAATPRSPQTPIQVELVSLVARGDAAAPPSLARERPPAAGPKPVSAPPNVHPRLVVEPSQPQSVRTAMPPADPPVPRRGWAELHPLPPPRGLPVRPPSVSAATVATAGPSAIPFGPDAAAPVHRATMALLPRETPARYSVIYPPALQRGVTNKSAANAGAAGNMSAVDGGANPTGAPANDADADAALAQRLECAATEAEAVLDLERRLEAILRADLQRHGIDF
jgi:hypothetical protein